MATQKVKIKAEAKRPDLSEYRFSLEFYVFKERHAYIAYCPSLDISTSGKDYNDAVANFYEMFQLHMEWCIENGTLYDDLIEHGWKIRKNGITPPTFSALAKKPEIKDLMNGGISFERIVTPARIPAFA